MCECEVSKVLSEAAKFCIVVYATSFTASLFKPSHPFSIHHFCYSKIQFGTFDSQSFGNDAKENAMRYKKIN